MNQFKAGCALVIIAVFITAACLGAYLMRFHYRNALLENGYAHYDGKTGEFVFHERLHIDEGGPHEIIR